MSKLDKPETGEAMSRQEKPGIAGDDEQIARQLARQRKARIIIASGRDRNDRSPVMVGVNGREFLIVRDQPVDVPEAVYNTLKLAVADVASMHGDGNFVRTDFQKANRFSWTMLGWVDPATGEVSA